MSTINEGEVAEILVTFKYPPSPPVRAWIQRPGAAQADQPVDLVATSDPLVYRGEYPTTDAGGHRIRIETASPVAAEESSFTVQASRVNKP